MRTTTDLSSEPGISADAIAAALPDHARIEALIAPFTKQRHPVESRRWRALARPVMRKYRREYLTKKWLGWLPRGGRGAAEMSEHYEDLWRDYPWPQLADPNPAKRGICTTWRGDGILTRHGGFGLKRAHQALLSAVIATLKPRSVLEVGCGNGLNLFVLSALHPGIEWAGIELTEHGVARARSVQAEPEIPAALREFLPGPVLDPNAYRAIDFRQGDVCAMPYADRAFDLVIGVQALEQMQSVRDAALAEIARVAGAHAAFVEPFRDFNQSPTQTHYRRAKGYLDLGIDELRGFGFDPLLIFDDLPQKVTLGVGLVAAARR